LNLLNNEKNEDVMKMNSTLEDETISLATESENKKEKVKIILFCVGLLILLVVIVTLLVLFVRRFRQPLKPKHSSVSKEYD
jgi:flagellar biogenesis protein FliO